MLDQLFVDPFDHSVQYLVDLVFVPDIVPHSWVEDYFLVLDRSARGREQLKGHIGVD